MDRFKGFGLRKGQIWGLSHIGNRNGPLPLRLAIPQLARDRLNSMIRLLIIINISTLQLDQLLLWYQCVLQESHN